MFSVTLSNVFRWESRAGDRRGPIAETTGEKEGDREERQEFANEEKQAR